MSEEKKKFTVDDFLKKVQEGDNTLLIVGALVMIIPLLALFFLVGGKSDKKMTQQKLKTMVQRKNVFNFTKDDIKKSTSQGTSKKSSSWSFTPRTQAQQIADEIHDVERIIEKKAAEIEVPSYLEGDARKQYLAEKNYNLCMANGAIEARRYEEAEEYIKKALDEAGDNNFLTVYALGSLCALYERMGDSKKIEEAYKLYAEAVGKLPPEYGGMDLKRVFRDTYQSLLVLGKHSNDSDISESLRKEPLNGLGALPSDINIKKVYKSFPVKYE